VGHSAEQSAAIKLPQQGILYPKKKQGILYPKKKKVNAKIMKINQSK